MMNNQRYHQFIGFSLFVLTLIIYTLTIEPTASYWDSGEFIATSYKLQIAHAPGAPLYQMIGRLVSFLALGDQSNIAFWVNMVSAISSAATIALLYWIIVMVGQKLVKNQISENNKLTFAKLSVSGMIGSLAFAFSDSFWFSAVEAEVYALSVFFMALVFWAILRWELVENDANANKWVVLIAFMIGLSIGVHPLNILAVPTIVLIYYFKTRPFSFKGLFYALTISGGLVLFLMYGLRLGLLSIAKYVEIIFVNSFGMPFGLGVALYGFLLIGMMVYGFRYSIKKNKVVLNTALLSLTYLIIGFASYSMVVIRSNFDPPLDPANPQDLPSFLSYLNMEQYGTRPLLYGPNFSAELVDQYQGSPQYVKGSDRYEVPFHKLENVYDPKQSGLFPRIYSHEDHHVKGYQQWLNLSQGESPKFSDNIKFLFKYQLNHMYLRYFLWNFAGKESDISGADWLAPWETGKKLPSSFIANKGRNNYLMLPLLLGILGLLFLYKREIKSFYMVITLFLMTGVVLVVYLNSPSPEPRERDYIYVASFFAFAIGIGFGSTYVMELIEKLLKRPIHSLIIATIITLAIPGIMILENWDDHDRSGRYYSLDGAINTLESCPPNAILFTGGDNDTYPLWYAQEVEGIRPDVRVIVTTHFNADWNIEQMTRKTNESAPLPISFEKKDFRRGVNDYIYLMSNPRFDTGIDLRQYLELVKERHPALIQQARGGGELTITPSNTFTLNVDKKKIIDQQLIPESQMNYLVDSMEISFEKNGIPKGDLMMLDLIANNHWERPICFTFTSTVSTELNLADYMVMQGMTYRLLPLKNPRPEEKFIDTDTMYTNIMTKSQWRGLDNPNVYHNDYYKRQLLQARLNFNELADALVKQGDIKRASEVLNRSLSVMPDDSIPYDATNADAVALLLATGNEGKAEEIATVMMDRSEEELNYYIEEKLTKQISPIQTNLYIMNRIVNGYRSHGDKEKAMVYHSRFAKLVKRLEDS